MPSQFSLIITLIAFFLLSNPLHTQSFSSFDKFRHHIKRFVIQELLPEPEEEIEISFLQLDEKMTPPSCPNPFEISMAQPGVSVPTNSVVVKCPINPPWTLYVPIQIKRLTDTVIAAHRIMPGDAISENDLLIQKRDKLQLYDGFFYDLRDVEGKVASRMIPAGTVLSKKNLKRSLLIKRNQNISLILKHGAIEISMLGVAKTDGYLNDTIKVINPSSKKIVDALVTGNNKAEISY